MGLSGSSAEPCPRGADRSRVTASLDRAKVAAELAAVLEQWAERWSREKDRDARRYACAAARSWSFRHRGKRRWRPMDRDISLPADTMANGAGKVPVPAAFGPFPESIWHTARCSRDYVDAQLGHKHARRHPPSRTSAGSQGNLMAKKAGSELQAPHGIGRAAFCHWRRSRALRSAQRSMISGEHFRSGRYHRD